MKSIDKEICGNIYTSREVKRNLDELCLRFGGRFSGSPDSAQSAEFIAGKFREYGLDNVHLEPFPLTVWERGQLHLKMISPVTREFSALALPYSPGCDQEFPLIDLGMGHIEDIQAAGDTLKGAAVLVDDINPPEGPNLHRLQKYINLLEAGIGAFLFVQNKPGMLAQTGSLAFDHSGSVNQVIPSMGLPLEVGAELRQWLTKGPVTLHLKMDNRLSKGTDQNVIGDLGDPEGLPTVIICGHYDGHDISQGAMDNGSGTVAVMEAARALAGLRNSLKGKIRFMLCGSEEMGLVGSHKYVDTHLAELDALRFVINLDCAGGNGPFILLVQNAPELKSVFKDVISEMAADIELSDHLVPFSDHFPFLLQGVPTAMCVTPGSSGRGWGHTFADTFEKVDLGPLQRSSAHAARLAVRIANMDKWPGLRKEKSQIMETIKPTQMENLLRFEKHWPF